MQIGDSQNRLFYRLLSVLCICFAVVACGDISNSDNKEPSVLRVGILPDQSRVESEIIYRPLFDYLAQQTGLEYQLVFPDSYQEILDLFDNREIEMAHFGGYTFAKAMQMSNAIPLVQRDTDKSFHSVILVQPESRIQSLQDLEGKSFSFGSDLSTSGHLMPRYFFIYEHDIMPEQYFADIRYSGSHDLTAQWVANGVVDAGVANAIIIENMLADGRVSEESIKILWVSPPYEDYVWAVQDSLPISTRSRIMDAFLNLSLAEETQKQMMENLGAGFYLPVSAMAYDKVAAIIETLEGDGSL